MTPPAVPDHPSRRAFFHAAGAVALAGPAALRAADPPSKLPDLRTPLTMPPPAGKKVGWAIVGLGKLSVEEILPAFERCERSKPVAFVSGSPEKAKALAARYDIPEKHIYDYDRFDALKDNPDVDVVYVVLPNSMHAEYTIRAAKAGKHVLCEKPMAPTSGECRAMIDACKAAGKKLMVAYRLHYEPHHQKAISIARAKVLLGPVRLVVAENTQQVPAGTWRTSKAMGGGPVPDIGIYCLQAARYLTGEEPTEVRASVYRPTDDPRFKEVEQRGLFTLSFPSGAQASCTCDYGLGTVSTFNMIGPAGAVRMENAFKYRGLTMTMTRPSGKEEPELPQIDQFAAEMDHFSNCVSSDNDPDTPGEEGLRDVTYIEAIYEAARTGKPVALGEKPA